MLLGSIGDQDSINIQEQERLGKLGDWKHPGDLYDSADENAIQQTIHIKDGFVFHKPRW